MRGASGTRSGLLRKSSVVVRTFLLGLCVVVFSNRAGLAGTDSNLRLAEHLVRRAVLPLLDSLAVPKAEPLAVRVLPANREESWFVQTRLLRDLQAAGYQNVTVGETGGQNSARLTLRVDRLGVRFVPLEDRDRQIRSVEVQLSGMLLAADGRTLWAGVLQKSSRDTVATADVPRLSESPYEFTYPAASRQRSKWSGVLESAALAGALGLITYLFYSYRTR